MSDAIRALKDTAAELTAKGKLPAALEAWRKVVAAAPDDVAASQKVAEVLAKLGQSAEAVKVYEDVAQRYAQKGLFFKASAVCRVLLSIDPGHLATQDLIASLYSRAKAQSPRPSPAPAPPPPPSDAVELEVPPTASGLPSIPLFSTLTHAQLKDVLSTSMEVRAFFAGEVVVAEGAPGDSMFALVEGTASIYRGWGAENQRRVANLVTGDIFGEAAMVSGAPRLATVVADGAAIALEFSREAMAKVVARHPEVGQRLDQFYRQRLLANALRASAILRGLPEADKFSLGARFQPRRFADGERILKEGQPADSVYLLLRGVCAAMHQSGDRYPDLKEGDVFGEVSVLTGGPATATVAASGPVLTLRLSAEEFKARVLNDAGASLAVKKLAKVRLERTAKFDQEVIEGEEIIEGIEDDTRV